MKEGRIRYFDELKGIAIILVVFCHLVVLSQETILGNIIMSFAWAAVPCFFMVTGGLMHRASAWSWKKWGMKLWKLYLSLSVWKLLYFVFYYISRDVRADAITIIKYVFFWGNISNVDIGPMWFMNAYLNMMFIYPITYFLYKKDEFGKQLLLYLGILLGVASIMASVANQLGITFLSQMLGLIPFAGYKNMLFYFILGIFLLEQREKMTEIFSRKKVMRWIPLVLIMIGILGVLGIKFADTGSFRWNGVYLTDGYNRLSTLVMAVGLYLVFSLKLYPGSVKVLEIIGQNTMGIYFLHYPVLILYKKICTMLVENYTDYYSFELNCIQTVIVVSLCMIITIVMKKIPVVKNIFM